MHTELEHSPCLARLLRELPDDAARPYDWREFQRRAHAAPAAAARVAGPRALAAAIVIALAVLATAIRLGAGARLPHPPAAAVSAVTADKEAPAAGGDASRAEREDVAARYWLERMPREPALVRVGTRAAVETLEDHIAQVDDLLTAGRAGRAPAQRLLVLQRERTQLVNSLVQVRYAETLADAAR